MGLTPSTLPSALINDPSQAYEFDTVALMKASPAIFSVDKTVKTKGYYSINDGGGASYLIKANQTVDNYGSHLLNDSKVALLEIPADGWAKTQWFGMRFDADYADWIATGNTNASTSEHDEFQACSDWAKANGLNIQMQAGTILLDGPKRVWVWPSKNTRMVCKGQGKSKTFIFNTIQNSTGDLLVNIPVGGQNADMPGYSEWSDFTILETGRGSLDGTGGVNPIAGAYIQGLTVKRVDIFNAGNRAITVEGVGNLELYEVEDVLTKDSWKQGLQANGFDLTGARKGVVRIKDTTVDGYNLIANTVGGLITDNKGVDVVTGISTDVTLDITGTLDIRNGYAQALRFLNGDIRTGAIRIRNIATPDNSTSLNTAAIQLGQTNLTMSNIDIDGVVGGGGIVTAVAEGTVQRVILNNVRVRNADLYDIYQRTKMTITGVDFERGDDLPSVIRGYVGLPGVDDTNIFSSSIIAQKPIGDIAGGLVTANSSGFIIEGSSIIEKGSTGGEDFFTETDFTDIRKSWGVDKLPDGWILVTDNGTGTQRESTSGLRMLSYESARAYIELKTKVDSSSGLYTIRFKMSESDSEAIRVFSSHGTIINDQLFQVTSAVTEQVLTNYAFTSDDLSFKIGRVGSYTGNKVIEYLKIELEP
tara:strand:- start:487 stop:2424 length:1938 start_codon:yes stop_codon:yes gene_type:complete